MWNELGEEEEEAALSGPDGDRRQETGLSRPDGDRAWRLARIWQAAGMGRIGVMGSRFCYHSRLAARARWPSLRSSAALEIWLWVLETRRGRINRKLGPKGRLLALFDMSTDDGGSSSNGISAGFQM